VVVGARRVVLVAVDPSFDGTLITVAGTVTDTSSDLARWPSSPTSMSTRAPAARAPSITAARAGHGERGRRERVAVGMGNVVWVSVDGMVVPFGEGLEAILGGEGHNAVALG